MMITTSATEVGLILRDDGVYELALYRRNSDRLIRFAVDPGLAWAIVGTLKAPITAEPADALP